MFQYEGMAPSDIVTIFRVGFTIRVCSVFSQPCLLFIKKCCLLLMYYPQSLADWTWQHYSYHFVTLQRSLWAAQ